MLEKQRRIKWTKDKMDLLMHYKSLAYSKKQIAEKMGLTVSQISNACFVYRILLSKEDLTIARKESGKKASLACIKKFGWINWTPQLLEKLKRLKELEFSNKEIAKKLKISEYAIANACFSHRILLDEKTRKRKQLEAIEKGRKTFSANVQKRGMIKEFDSDLAYIVGVLFGDGSAVDMGIRGCVELRTTNKKFAIAFYKALYNYTKIKPKYHVRVYDKSFKNENRLYKDIKYHEVFFNSIYFVKNIIKIFGKTTTKDWIIDVDYVLSLGKTFCNNLIKGLFDSEGSFCIRNGKNNLLGTIGFSTTNEKGAKSLIELLKKLGYNFRLNVVIRPNTTEYKIRTGKLDIINKFFRNIGFNVDYKQERLENFISNRLRNF